METMATGQIWVGRSLSGIAVAFLLFDAAGKLCKVQPVVEGTLKLGFAERHVVTLGLLLMAGIVLYVIPRTSMLGALYLAAYLGGAVAAQLRVGNPLPTHVLFPVYVAGLLWGGLLLRHPGLLRILTGGV